MLAVAANTEVIVFRVRLATIRHFVGVTPAAMDRDPETMNIIDPQIGTINITEVGSSETGILLKVTGRYKVWGP